MKHRRRLFWAYALAAVIALSFVLPAAIASQPDSESHPGASTESTEGSAAGNETETEALSQVIGQILSRGYDLSLDVSFEEPMREAISSAAKSFDMSWAKEAAFTGTSSGNDDGGIDASGTLSLNGTDLYDGSISVDVNDQIVYLVCPQFRKTPFAVDLKKLASAAQGAAQTAGKSTAGKKAVKAAGNFKASYMKLLQEGTDLVKGIQPEELTAFSKRYADVFAQNAEQVDHEKVTVTAGALSEAISTHTITVDQDAMSKILSASRDALADDSLVRKILKSDFAVDAANTIVTAVKSDGLFDQETLYKGYQGLLKKADEGVLSKVPGFSLTYGMDGEGRLASLDLNLLYSGVEVNLFTLKMLVHDTHAAIQFDLGTLVSALAASKFGGDANGETGILLEADTEENQFNGTASLTVAGQLLGQLEAKNFAIDDAGHGKLNGSLSLTAGEAVFEAVFSSEMAGEVKVTGRYNGTDYLTVTASAAATDHAKVKKINRKKAMEVYDQSAWDAYIKDARLTKMIRKLASGGVPDSIVDTLTSGEAVTEKSRENTVERDGTGELENGEVGGADIGHDK